MDQSEIINAPYDIDYSDCDITVMQRVKGIEEVKQFFLRQNIPTKIGQAVMDVFKDGGNVSEQEWNDIDDVFNIPNKSLKVRRI